MRSFAKADPQIGYSKMEGDKHNGWLRAKLNQSSTSIRLATLLINIPFLLCLLLGNPLDVLNSQPFDCAHILVFQDHLGKKAYTTKDTAVTAFSNPS